MLFTDGNKASVCICVRARLAFVAFANVPELPHFGYLLSRIHSRRFNRNFDGPAQPSPDFYLIFSRSNFSCTTLRHTLAWYAAGLGYAAVEGGPQEMELLHERRSRVNTDGIVSTAAARYSLESTHLRCAGRISKEEIKSRSPEHHWAAIVLYRHL